MKVRTELSADEVKRLVPSGVLYYLRIRSQMEGLERAYHWALLK